MKKNTFVEGTLIASVAIIITKIIGALYVIPFYAIVGESGGALYSYGYTVYSLFLNLSVAGIPFAMSKIISEYNALGQYEAKERSYKLGRNIITIMAVFAFFILFIFAEEFSILLLGDLTGGNSITDVTLVVRCVSLCLLIIPFLSVSKGYLQGHKFISPTSTSQVIEQLTRTIFIVVASYIVVKVCNQPSSIGVAISMFGALIGGIVTYIYIKYKIKSNKDKFPVYKDGKVDDVSNKVIIKKIIKYSIPLIVLSIVTDIYSLTDLTLIIRGSYMFGYTAIESETIASIICTWGVKICMIINAIAMGVTTSLTPHLTENNVKGEKAAVNHKFNQSVSLMISIGLPMAIGIGILGNPLYTLFYGESTFGPLLLWAIALVCFTASIHLVLNAALQALNKYKLLYVNTITGIVINASLDIPMMMLLYKLGLPALYGACLASMIGYVVSFSIILINLNKTMNFNYKIINKCLLKTILGVIIMAIPLLLLNMYLPISSTNYLIKIGICVLYGIVGLIIYFLIGYKTKLLEDVLGKTIVDKIMSKLHFR